MRTPREGETNVQSAKAGHCQLRSRQRRRREQETGDLDGPADRGRERRHRTQPGTRQQSSFQRKPWRLPRKDGSKLHWGSPNHLHARILQLVTRYVVLLHARHMHALFDVTREQLWTRNRGQTCPNGMRRGECLGPNIELSQAPRSVRNGGRSCPQRVHLPPR